MSGTNLFPLSDCRQLLGVRAADWDADTGILYRFQRSTVKAGWQAAGAPMPVMLGRTGLAWGLGRHPQEADMAPTKREGDGKAPAGVFDLPLLFGEAAELPGAMLPYRATDANLLAVDDPASRHYNRLVDTRQVAADWTSAETMRRADERYRLGAVIAHNWTQPQTGAGSCIFLHVWQAPGVPTAGCTALAEDDVRSLCLWLQPAMQPRLAQLAAAEWDRRAAAWDLPDWPAP